LLTSRPNILSIVLQGGSPTSQNLDAVRNDAPLMAARWLFEQAAAEW
jgi:hypothetical protein